MNNSETVNSVNRVVVIKYNNSFDVFKSLETGVVQCNKSMLSKPGDILVLNNTNDNTYVIGGLITTGQRNVTTNVDWFNTNQDDYKFEHRIKSITPFRIFTKNEFETNFKSERSIRADKPLGTSFHHYINLDDEQLEMMLA